MSLYILAHTVISAMVACERDCLHCQAFFFNKESWAEDWKFQVPLPDRWAIRRNCKMLGFNAGFRPHSTQFTSYRIRKYRNSRSAFITYSFCLACSLRGRRCVYHEVNWYHVSDMLQFLKSTMINFIWSGFRKSRNDIGNFQIFAVLGPGCSDLAWKKCKLEMV